MKILLYTFNARFNLTFILLRRVSDKNIDKFYLSNLNSVYSLCRKITLKNYDFILGLGDFRRDAKKVRIETGFINKYGINKINENGENFYTATWNLPAFNDCYYSDKTSNGHAINLDICYPKRLKKTD